jgi:hypothetical protein
MKAGFILKFFDQHLLESFEVLPLQSVLEKSG